MVTAGLSDVVRYGRLRHRSDGQIRPYAPTLFDDELLTAVDAAAARFIPLGIVLPMPATATAITLGAAVTVSAITRARTLAVTVAVISKQLAHRTLYDQLYFEDQRLREFIPRARLTGDGQITAVGRARNDSGGRLLLTGDLTRLNDRLEQLHALVIDASAVQPYELRPLLSLPAAGTPVVYLTGNPLDPALADVRAAGGVIWSWDVEDLPALSGPVSARRPLAALDAAGRRAAASARSALVVPSHLLTACGTTRRTIWLPIDPNAVHSTPATFTGPATSRATVAARAGTAQARADRELDDALTETWRALGTLAGTYRPGARTKTDRGAADALQHGAADLALRWVWAVFNTLSMLPIDPARYDLLLPVSPWATRLTAAPEQARTYARAAPAHLSSPWLRVADALERTLRAGAAAPKLGRVLDWVNAVARTDPAERLAADPLGLHRPPLPRSPTLQTATTSHQAAPATRPAEEPEALDVTAGRALLITRNRTAAAALAQVLDEHPATPLGWADHVAVVSVSDVLHGRARTDSHLLLCGPVPRSAAGLLAMPATSTVTVVAAGAFEGNRILAQMKATSTALRSLRTETVTLSAPTLRVAPHRTDLFGAALSFEAAVGDTLQPMPTHPDAPGWDPFDADVLALLARLGAERSDDLPAPPVRTDAADIDVETIAVWLGRASSPAAGPFRATAAEAAQELVLLAPDDLVHRRRGDTLAYVAAKSLQPGDVVVLVDAGARAELFATITARLAELPGFSTLTQMMALWRKHAAAARDTGLTHEQIWKRVHDAGSVITSPGTVGSWIRGQVDGPADSADIGRFAAAVGDRELAANATAIGKAVRAVHSAHRKVGHWLSGQISGAMDRDDPDQLVDVNLGVHVTDLLESVSLHPVAYVDLTARTVPAALVGVVFDRAVALSYGLTAPD